MSMGAKHDSWTSGQSYEHYMGRWSRKIAEKFVDWVDPPANADWLEVGCGTGALTKTILSNGKPRSILATDLSDNFVAHAQADNADERIRFETADATLLPCFDASMDIVTSALVLNFVPDKQKAFAEMRRVLRPDGFLAFYVWDYPGGGMGFIDAFWKAAAEIDVGAAELDEGPRFPFCQQDGLAQLCHDAGIADANIEALEIETQFSNFEALWYPFTLGVGPAPGYLKTLTESHQSQLKAHLATKFEPNGPVSLPARAWAGKGQLAR